MITLRGDFGKLAKLGGGLKSLPSTLASVEPVIGARIGSIESGRARSDGAGRTPGTWPQPWSDAAEEEISKALAKAVG